MLIPSEGLCLIFESSEGMSFYSESKKKKNSFLRVSGERAQKYHDLLSSKERRSSKNCSNENEFGYF